MSSSPRTSGSEWPYVTANQPACRDSDEEAKGQRDGPFGRRASRSRLHFRQAKVRDERGTRGDEREGVEHARQGDEVGRTHEEVVQLGSHQRKRDECDRADTHRLEHASGSGGHGREVCQPAWRSLVQRLSLREGIAARPSRIDAMSDLREPRLRRRLDRVRPAVTADAVLNLVSGELRPAMSGAWLDKRRPADGAPLCAVARSGSDGRRPRSPPRGRRSLGGPSARPSSAATSSARSPSCCASAARRPPRSSPTRRGSRSRSRAARRTPRSRWGSSSPARAGARTGGRRPPRCRTAPC